MQPPATEPFRTSDSMTISIGQSLEDQSPGAFWGVVNNNCRYSPVQQSQQGQTLIAHRGPTARKKPVLIAVLGPGRRLLHQCLLLGFVQGVLVQQVKLQSPQPRPSAPPPP